MSFTAARVEESLCIGCTKCLPLCPTGALVGAPKGRHTVLTALCTGCAGCVQVCPAHCITMAPVQAAAVPLQTNATALLEVTNRHTARMQALAGLQRSQHTQNRPQASLSAPLPDSLAKLAAAARQKSARKYASKGPLRTPKALAK